MATVAVVGGGGLVSQCASYDLASDRTIERIIVADIDMEMAKRVAAATNRMSGSRKAEAVQVDVRNTEKASRAVKGADILVNGVQYDFNEQVMSIALRAHAHYLDFGGLYYMTKRQLTHSMAFRRNGLLAVVGMGAEPGLSGIIAAELCAGMDTVETIRIRDAWRDNTRNVPPFFVTWSIQTLMDEYSMKGEVLEGGRIKSYPPLHLSEDYDFPEPVGRTRVYSTRHSEMATFPASFRSKGVKNVNWMEGGPGFLEQKILADAGFSERKPISVGGSRVSPRAFLAALLKSRGLLGYPKGSRPDSYECLAVDVSGMRGSIQVRERRTCTFPSKPEWGAGAAEYSVGVPGAIAARIMAAGVEMAGVYPPEVAFNSDQFYPELRKRGFILSEVEGV